MLTPHGLKVLDFGLARPSVAPIAGGTDDTRGLSATTAPGVLVGTVAYMAPDVINGAPAGVRSDLRPRYIL